MVAIIVLFRAVQRAHTLLLTHACEHLPQAAILPLGKLMGLAMKHISKPISKQIVTSAKTVWRTLRARVSRAAHHERMFNTDPTSINTEPGHLNMDVLVGSGSQQALCVGQPRSRWRRWANCVFSCRVCACLLTAARVRACVCFCLRFSVPRDQSNHTDAV